MEITRNLCRHRLQSFLAISGMVIGQAALTTTGALAENFNSLLDGGVQYYGAKVQVGPPEGQPASLMSLTKIDEIRQVPKVAVAFRHLPDLIDLGQRHERGGLSLWRPYLDLRPVVLDASVQERVEVLGQRPRRGERGLA